MNGALATDQVAKALTLGANSWQLLLRIALAEGSTVEDTESYVEQVERRLAALEGIAGWRSIIDRGSASIELDVEPRARRPDRRRGNRPSGGAHRQEVRRQPSRSRTASLASEIDEPPLDVGVDAVFVEAPESLAELE